MLAKRLPIPASTPPVINICDSVKRGRAPLLLGEKLLLRRWALLVVMLFLLPTSSAGVDECAEVPGDANLYCVETASGGSGDCDSWDGSSESTSNHVEAWHYYHEPVYLNSYATIQCSSTEYRGVRFDDSTVSAKVHFWVWSEEVDPRNPKLMELDMQFHWEGNPYQCYMILKRGRTYTEVPCPARPPPVPFALP